MAAAGSAAAATPTAWLSQGGAETELAFGGGCLRAEGQGGPVVCAVLPATLSGPTVDLATPGQAILRLSDDVTSVSAHVADGDGMPVTSSTVGVSRLDAHRWTIDFQTAVAGGHRVRFGVVDDTSYAFVATLGAADVSPPVTTEGPPPPWAEGGDVLRRPRIQRLVRDGRTVRARIATGPGAITAYAMLDGVRRTVVVKLVPDAEGVARLRLDLPGKRWRRLARHGRLMVVLKGPEGVLRARQPLRAA